MEIGRLRASSSTRRQDGMPRQWVHFQVLLAVVVVLGALCGGVTYFLSRKIDRVSGYERWMTTRSYWSGSAAALLVLFVFFLLREAVINLQRRAKNLLFIFMLVVLFALLLCATIGSLKFVMWWQLDHVNHRDCVFIQNSTTSSSASDKCKNVCLPAHAAARSCCCCGDIPVSDDKTIMVYGVNECPHRFGTAMTVLVFSTALDYIEAILLAILFILCIDVHRGCCGPSLSNYISLPPHQAYDRTYAVDAGETSPLRSDLGYGYGSYNTPGTTTTHHGRHRPSAPPELHGQSSPNTMSRPPAYHTVVS